MPIAQHQPWWISFKHSVDWLLPYVFASESIVTVTHFWWLLPHLFSSERVVTVTHFWRLVHHGKCCNSDPVPVTLLLQSDCTLGLKLTRKYLTALANLTVVKKQYPCNSCYVTCMFCNRNRFGGTLSPLHQILFMIKQRFECYCMC